VTPQLPPAQPPGNPPPASPLTPSPGQSGANGSQLARSPAVNDQISKQLIDKYEAKLKYLTDRHCRDAVDREKIFQYAMVRRNDFYFRGNQHLAPTFTGTGELVDYKPVNNTLLLRATGATAPNSTIYDYVINHFRGDIRKFVAVLGNKAPNVTARPAWQRDENGVRRSNIANDCISYLSQQWDVDSANRYLTLSLAKNGTTFIHTPYVADGERYGTHVEPVWGMQPQKIEPDGYNCQNCGQFTPGPSPFRGQQPSSGTGTPQGMANSGLESDQLNLGGTESTVSNPQTAAAAPPVQFCPNCRQPLDASDWAEGQTQQVPGITGQQSYPNGTVELHIHSTYDVTTAFYLKDLEHCPWLFVDGKEDASVLVSKFPGRGLEADLAADRASTESFGGSAKAFGDLARLQASSPTGYGMVERPNRWDYTRFWLRPHMYWYLSANAASDSDSQELLQQLQQNYPRGLKMTFANKHLVALEHERLDEVWAIVKPETSEYIYADPIFNDYVQGADLMNDAWNINAQLLETSIPWTIFDPNVLDPRKIRTGFQPNEFIPAIPGTPLDRAFYKGPVTDPKVEIVQFQKILIDTLREIIGLLPAIWGGDENVQTAEQARRRLNQALMVLATTWNEIRNGWSKAYRNGVRQLARYSLGRLVNSQGDPESVTSRDIQDIQDVLNGGWDCTCDQAIPMNWTQLRDFVGDLFQMNPMMAQALGAQKPNNLEKIAEGIGLPGWEIENLDEYKRIKDLIARLQQAAPIQPPPQPPPPPGMPPMPPPPPQPSIPLDFNVTWNPNMVMKVVHEWLMSEDGRSAEGTPGFDNVVAAGQSALQAMAPPPGPPGGPGGPGGPAPPPGGGKPPLAPGASPTSPAGPADQRLPAPLEPQQPPEAPEAPLMPIVPPQGGLANNPALIQ
jgi:hypothetical protein